MDQRRQAEGRQQQHLTLTRINGVLMHVALGVCRNNKLWPLPVLQSLRVELELPGERGKSCAGLAVNLHAHRRPLLVDYARDGINLCAFESFFPQ